MSNEDIGYETRFTEDGDDALDIEKIESEEEDYESSPSEYEISTYPADYTLEGLYGKWKKGSIIIPKFQRNFVWKQVQASKLIESFLLGLPVPAVFLYTERSTQKHLVIDGQQRLKSVFYFFEGYFGDENSGSRRVFRLKGLSENSKWYNKAFADFDDDDKRKLEDCVLRSFIVNQLDPDDDTSIYHIFERLNTGGTLLTNQEVRNCIYGGKLNDLMIELNDYPSWRQIIGKPLNDRRNKDIELILRFLSLISNIEYKKPMKDFLTSYMKQHRNPKPEFLKNMEENFKNTCDRVLEYLPYKPFHIRAGLNSGAFDSTMVAFSRNLTDIPGDISERYTYLTKNNDSFFEYTSKATTDEKVVQNRLELAEKILFGDAEYEI